MILSKRCSLIFVIQRHAASHLHFDLRLELNGVLKSWAIPKQPSMTPSIKRLAIQVEDHDLDYAYFEGTIPEGHYGAGKVTIWDHGHYHALGVSDRKQSESILKKQFSQGEMSFTLSGTKLKGDFALVRMKKNNPDENLWLFLKMKKDT